LQKSRNVEIRNTFIEKQFDTYNNLINESMDSSGLFKRRAASHENEAAQKVSR
jgi:hypothetical protein